jgi:integrase
MRKNEKDFIIPLSTQAVEILEEIHPLSGDGVYIFPGARSKKRPMSENTVTAALRRLGYTGKEMTGHGFRTMASTLLHEQGWLSDAVERQLAHVDGSVKGVYNAAEHLDVRKEMMQSWADYLDGLKAGGKIVSIGKRHG